MKPIVWIDGIIGAGKTTISKEIAKNLNFRPLLEPVDSNPYLTEFYKDPKRWAFPMQIDLLLKRYSMHKLANMEAMSDSSQFNGVVLDRDLPGDRVFAKVAYLAGNISELEWQTYNRAFKYLTNNLAPPSLLVFLDVDPKIAKSRLEARKRESEVGIPLEYFQKLYRGYLDVLTEIESGNTVWGRGVEIFKIGWNTDYLPTNEITGKIRKKFNLEINTKRQLDLKKFLNE